jgi:hypothetical protein
MERFCTCCGHGGYLERHHVGGRKYSSLITSLCVGCHDICTVTDVYERKWRDNEPAIAHVWAGVMDVWGIFAGKQEVELGVVDVLADAEWRGIWQYRPCSRVPAWTNDAHPDRLTQQLTELNRLTNYLVAEVWS